MRITVIHSVPANGGDQALLLGLLRLLRDKYGAETEISVGCTDPDLARQLFPDRAVTFFRDFEDSRSRLRRRATSELLRFLADFAPWSVIMLVGRLLLLTRREWRFVRQADLIVSCPGGFLHDHYRPIPRLVTLGVLRLEEKPVVIVGQSLGPFSRKSSQRMARKVLPSLSAIGVRDKASVDYLLQAGVSVENVCVTGDVAFSLWSTPGTRRLPSTPARLVMSWREWPLHDAEASRVTVTKASQLVRALLEGAPQLKITFMSTCQGVADYVDDSTMSAKIRAELPRDLLDRTDIDSRYHNAEQLLRSFAAYDLYVGMRLHGAILSLMAGTPAVAIGYETKSAEIMGSIGLAWACTSIEEGAGEWLSVATSATQRYQEYSELLPQVLQSASALAWSNSQLLPDHF